MDNEKQAGEETTQQEGAQTPSEPTTESTANAEEKSTGAIIGAIIIVVLLVIGGLYFLGQRVSEELAPEEILSQPDPVAEALETQGTSDEIAAIEEDIGTEEDFEDLDAEFANIEAELNF